MNNTDLMTAYKAFDEKMNQEEGRTFCPLNNQEVFHIVQTAFCAIPEEKRKNISNSAVFGEIFRFVYETAYHQAAEVQTKRFERFLKDYNTPVATQRRKELNMPSVPILLKCNANP